MTKLKFCFLLGLMIWNVDVAQGGKQESSSGYFDVKSFGARGNGRTDDSQVGAPFLRLFTFSYLLLFSSTTDHIRQKPFSQ